MNVATDTVDGWRNGLLVFRDAPLHAVISEINRYRPGLVILMARDQAERRVSGVFHLERLDEEVRQEAVRLQRAL